MKTLRHVLAIIVMAALCSPQINAAQKTTVTPSASQVKATPIVAQVSTSQEGKQSFKTRLLAKLTSLKDWAKAHKKPLLVAAGIGLTTVAAYLIRVGLIHMDNKNIFQPLDNENIFPKLLKEASKCSEEPPCFKKSNSWKTCSHDELDRFSSANEFGKCFDKVEKYYNYKAKNYEDNLSDGYKFNDPKRQAALDGRDSLDKAWKEAKNFWKAYRVNSWY